MVPMHQTLVMPLQNGTQKEKELGPDFRRDDGKSQNDGQLEDKKELAKDL
jgi:hypothetical protein